MKQETLPEISAAPGLGGHLPESGSILKSRLATPASVLAWESKGLMAVAAQGRGRLLGGAGGWEPWGLPETASIGARPKLPFCTSDPATGHPGQKRSVCPEVAGQVGREGRPTGRGCGHGLQPHFSFSHLFSFPSFPFFLFFQVLAHIKASGSFHTLRDIIMRKHKNRQFHMTNA